MTTHKMVNGKKVELTPEEQSSYNVKQALAEDATTSIAATDARRMRSKYLADCDWVVLRHAERGESTPIEWSEYREALRDVPYQDGFPLNIKWPAKPTKGVV